MRHWIKGVVYTPTDKSELTGVTVTAMIKGQRMWPVYVKLHKSPSYIHDLKDDLTG